MTKYLKLTTIAEGVENRDQLLILRAQNCDEIQGFYFSKALTGDDFAKIFNKLENEIGSKL